MEDTFSNNIKNINSKTAYNLINENKDLIVLDVRDTDEFESGHLKNAINIPLHKLSIKIDEIEKYKDSAIIVHCLSGGRSPKAVEILEENGFTNILHLSRGIMSWSYPLYK